MAISQTFDNCLCCFFRINIVMLSYDTEFTPVFRALITASATPFCFCAMQKHLTI